ncbi:MAG: hypothetical protein ACR2PX_00450 [Endozoicomonas sp.]|uniref:hypothetical protein n=1 Tax=Endozoicomonas sp. TaxID=1892382 RepID=UPI003D9B05AC
MLRKLTLLCLYLVVSPCSQAALIQTVTLQLGSEQLMLNVFEDNGHVTYQLYLPGYSDQNTETTQGTDEVDSPQQTPHHDMLNLLNQTENAVDQGSRFEEGNPAWRLAAGAMKRGKINEFCRYCGKGLTAIEGDASSDPTGVVARGAPASIADCSSCKGPLQQSGIGWISTEMPGGDIYEGAPTSSEEILRVILSWIREHRGSVFIHLYFHRNQLRALYGFARTIHSEQQQVVVEGAILPPLIEASTPGFQFIADHTANQVLISPFSYTLLAQLHGALNYVLQSGALAQLLQAQCPAQRCLPFITMEQLGLVQVPAVGFIPQGNHQFLVIPDNGGPMWKLIIETQGDGTTFIRFLPPKLPEK